jgi:hypothetical protein
MNPMNPIEARRAFQADKQMLLEKGISWDGYEPTMYLPESWRYNAALAYDAQPASITTASAGIPWIFTNIVDPEIYHIIFAANEITQVISEERRGTWIDDTILFPQVENGGEVSSYDDYSESGSTTANADFPMRQQYVFQIHKKAGDREVERAGAAKINLIAEKDRSAALIMDKFSNLAYAFGITGLYNYGLLNDPLLPASLTPSTKTDTGGTVWLNTTTGIFATPNEIYNDIQFLYARLVHNTQGRINSKSKLTLAMHPDTEAAIKATNSFGLNVYDMLSKNLPNMRIQTAVQYGALSVSNPQGIAAGNMIQLIADELEGMKVAYCVFGEKMRTFPMVRGTSSFMQKVVGGVWGTVIRIPIGIISMVGV